MVLEGDTPWLSLSLSVTVIRFNNFIMNNPAKILKLIRSDAHTHTHTVCMVWSNRALCVSSSSFFPTILDDCQLEHYQEEDIENLLVGSSVQTMRQCAGKPVWFTEVWSKVQGTVGEESSTGPRERWWRKMCSYGAGCCGCAAEVLLVKVECFDFECNDAPRGSWVL